MQRYKFSAENPNILGFLTRLQRHFASYAARQNSFDIRLTIEYVTLHADIGHDCWQQLQDRIENIEKYVKDTTETVCISDEDIFLNNDQA